MFDEEVNFYVDRDAPKNKNLEFILNSIETLGTLAGGIGGYFLAFKGLEFNQTWGLIIGGAIGSLVTYQILSEGKELVQSIRKRGYEMEQRKLDKIALEGEANSVNFTYRGNNVLCTLRPEYEETGKVFYMSINDRIVENPVFSYQPSRDKNLKFRFEIPVFKGKKPSVSDIKALRSKRVFVGHEYDQAIKEFEEGGVKLKNAEYINALREIVQKSRADLETGEKLSIDFSTEKTTLFTLLEYTGENFSSRRGLFARCSSELMNKAYEIRSKC